MPLNEIDVKRTGKLTHRCVSLTCIDCVARITDISYYLHYLYISLVHECGLLQLLYARHCCPAPGIYINLVCVSIRVVESESLKVGKSLKIG